VPENKSDIKVLALVGSLRAASINRKIAELAAAVAPDGVTVTVFEGLAELPFYNEEIDDATDGGQHGGIVERVWGPAKAGHYVPLPATSCRSTVSEYPSPWTVWMNRGLCGTSSIFFRRRAIAWSTARVFAASG